MVQVFSENALSEFGCTCKYPHFKEPFIRASFGCHDKMRARLRSASGVYFPITKSALLIPPWSKKVVNYIQKNYNLLKSVEEEKIIHVIQQNIHDSNITDDEIMRSWNAVKLSMEQKKTF